MHSPRVWYFRSRPSCECIETVLRPSQDPPTSRPRPLRAIRRTYEQYTSVLRVIRPHCDPIKTYQDRSLCFGDLGRKNPIRGLRSATSFSISASSRRSNMNLAQDEYLLLALLLQHEALAQQEEAMRLQLAVRILRRRRRRRGRPRQMWVRSWLTEGQRLAQGDYNNLMETLRNRDPQHFIRNVRMPPELFDEILQRVTPYIQGPGNNLRPSLDPGMKLAVTLRHLATGDQYPSLSYAYRISRSSIIRFVPIVCQAIIDVYRDEVFHTPTTPEEWMEIAQEFERRWQVPHAIGALDGKHVKMRNPPNSGSDYWCVYKHCYSIVLMALVDHDYKFLWVDTGGLGHQSDAQIFNASTLKERLDTGHMGLPRPRPLPEDVPPEDAYDAEDAEEPTNVPYFILADDAFAMRTYLMKPWAKRNMSKEEVIYNYRISRARRVVENAFGIMCNRWRCLLNSMYQGPETVQTIVECCVVLHNLMRTRRPDIHGDVDREDEHRNIIPAAWRQEVPGEDGDPAPPEPPNRDKQAAKNQRLFLQDYFNGRGAVAWQEDMINLNRD